MFEGEVGIALDRKRARTPVGQMHLMPVPALGRAGILWPITARSVVDATDEGRGDD
jgi:hypothetical protein